MKFLSRVVWSEGMYLGAQHFQAQSRYFEDSLWFLSSGLRNHPWGLLSLSLDAEAIRNGHAVLRHASGIFADGLAFDIPESDPAPPPVSLKELFLPTDSEITLALSIPKRTAGGLDCDLAEDSGNSARYRAVDHTVRDDTAGQDEYPVALGTKNITLCSALRVPPGSLSFPLARIVRDGKGGFAVDPEFIPPCLRLSANETLLVKLVRLVESLEERTRTVSRGKRRQGHFEVGTSALDVANYWFLHALCSAIPGLRQHLASRQGHPEQLYLDLVRLAGALSTFSLETDLGSVPAYNHLELAQVFGGLDAFIRRHLEIVVPSNAVTLDFTRVEPYLYAAEIADERCLRRSRWIFGIRSGMGEAELLRTVPQLVKICSGEGAAKLVQRALPGLELQHLPVPPAALSAEADMHYFSISATGACWQHMQQTRRVGVYLPGEIRDAFFEITVLLETAP